MPRVSKPLADTTIRAAKPGKTVCKLSDGNGLPHREERGTPARLLRAFVQSGVPGPSTQAGTAPEHDHQ